jgi:uncharacterized protein YbbC (DUF1343 family)/CubicO group peptidase (beta-lactamase class C family)
MSEGRDRSGRQRIAAIFVAILLLCQAACPSRVLAAGEVQPDDRSAIDQISRIATDEIQTGHLQGAVIVAGVQGQVVFRQAIGMRRVKPDPAPMKIDTIFDLASLTKVVATTTAIMQLSEAGLIDLKRPVADYWPAFAKSGKASITIADLLAHYAALPPDLPTDAPYADYATAIQAIEEIAPVAEPGTRFVYSDIDFAALGEIVRRVSGLPLDVYAAKHIFNPLAMRATTFEPSLRQRDRVAPADVEDGKLIWGQVHDPMARRMGGVAGHAGVFSTADDLTRFVKMLLAGGTLDGHRILASASVDAMTTPQSPAGQPALRGYGWDIDSPYSTTLAPAFSLRSFGHTGYTGTALWVDPSTRSFLIVLTNRLHPDGTGSARMLQRRLAAVVGELAAAKAGPRRILTGIDVLEGYRFRPLIGHRVALLSNASGRDAAGHRTADVLAQAPGVMLQALFSPEHGFDSSMNQPVHSTIDQTTGLPIYSLYGETLRPTDAMLNGIDSLVIDLPDVGARFYTYATTMAYAMEAAAAKGIDVYVLDRPNPISADIVQGPMLTPDLTSFTAYMPMPVRHGMTIGELAAMFNEERHIGAKLHVIAMRSYDRHDWFDETGLKWMPPSPNLHRLEEVTLYPGVAMVEGANVSVGRGTTTPFEVLGAPWIDGKLLAVDLNARHIPGIRFRAIDFTPSKDAFAAELCHGVQISIADREQLDSPRLGIELIAALQRHYPGIFTIDATLQMIGSQHDLSAIKYGEDPGLLADNWRVELAPFLLQRDKYQIYGSAR